MSQKEMIIKYINEKGYITSFEAYTELGITQLATRIKELKEKGLKFRTEQIAKVNRYGKKIHFVKYILEEK